MKNKKYNWAKLKTQFMESEYDTIRSFFRAHFRTKREPSGPFKQKTKGWAEEKRQLNLEAQFEAQADVKEALKDDYAIDIEELRKFKKILVDSIRLDMSNRLVYDVIPTLLIDKEGNPVKDKKGKYVYVDKVKQVIRMSSKDFKTYYQILKIELGEPTVIAKNENTVKFDEESMIRKLQAANKNSELSGNSGQFDYGKNPIPVDKIKQ